MVDSFTRFELEVLYRLPSASTLSIDEFLQPYRGWYDLAGRYGQALQRLDPILSEVTFSISPYGLQYGSLKQRFLLRCIWADEEEGLLRTADRIRESRVMRSIRSHPKVMGGIAILVVLSSIGWALKQPLDCGLEFLGEIKSIREQLEKLNENEEDIRKKTADALEVDEELVKRATSILPDDPKPTHSSIRGVSLPLIRYPDSFLTSNASGDLRIPSSLFVEASNILDRIKPTEKHYKNVRIEFRRADIDKRNQWAAVAPTVYHNRVKSVLAPKINRVRLYGISSAEVDLIAKYKLSEEGEYIPTQYTIVAVHSTEGKSDSNDQLF